MSDPIEPPDPDLDDLTEDQLTGGHMTDELTTLRNAIDLLEHMGVSVMEAARKKVNAAYHSVPEGAVDLAAVTALDTARRALIEVRRGAQARVGSSDGEDKP